MSGENIVHVLKTYNEEGLFKAIFAAFGWDQVLIKNTEKSVRINSGDANIFNMLERRLARAKLMRSVNTFGNKASEFNEQLVGFTTAMSAAYDYVMNKNIKHKHYAVYLTYTGELDSSPSYTITIRSISSGDVMMMSAIREI